MLRIRARRRGLHRMHSPAWLAQTIFLSQHLLSLSAGPTAPLDANPTAASVTAHLPRYYIQSLDTAAGLRPARQTIYWSERATQEERKIERSIDTMPGRLDAQPPLPPHFATSTCTRCQELQLTPRRFQMGPAVSGCVLYASSVALQISSRGPVCPAGTGSVACHSAHAQPRPGSKHEEGRSEGGGLGSSESWHRLHSTAYAAGTSAVGALPASTAPEPQPPVKPTLTSLLRHLVQLCVVPRLAAISGDVHTDDALAAATPSVALDCRWWRQWWVAGVERALVSQVVSGEAGVLSRCAGVAWQAAGGGSDLDRAQQHRARRALCPTSRYIHGAVTSPL